MDKRNELRNSCGSDNSFRSYSEDQGKDKYTANTAINNENNTSYGPNGYEGENITERANDFLDCIDGSPTDYRSKMQSSPSDVINMGRDRIAEKRDYWRSRKKF
ncbi:MAG: hypothetical protein LUF90_01930 [Rikenellaceae bacterium]|nr:hypothetical protein [Rikenellaceae bacterium]